MGKRVFRLFAGAAAALVLTASPALSQLSAVTFPAPPSTRAVGGKYPLRWDDRFVSPLYDCLYSLTWYYSPDRGGAGKQRISTYFRDDFAGGLRTNWAPQGQFIFDWDVREDRATSRRYLVAPKLAGPAVSRDPFPADTVVSVLVRPVGIKPEFSIGVRMQANGRGYELQNAGSSIRVTQSGKPLPGGERRLLRVTPTEWYWYEIGILNKKNRREVEIRVRVLDEKREKVLVQFDPITDRPLAGMDKGGFIQLTGPAHFAEVNVDPWRSRWADDNHNEFMWDTALVPDGDYFLIAEVHDGKSPVQLFSTDYQVQVRNREPVAAGN